MYCVNYACAGLLHHENYVEMACRSKTPAKALSSRIQTRHQSREESMESSRESCRQSSREEGKVPSNYSAAEVGHCCCLCFPAAMRKYIELANQFSIVINTKWLESLQEVLYYIGVRIYYCKV